MFQRILVPLDGPPLAEVALAAAALLARRFEADVVLVRVAPDSLTDSSKATVQDEATTNPHVYLEQVAHWLKSEGDVAHTAIVTEAVPEGIAHEATLDQADLIVMTTHGRKGVDALLHPSVTWQVLSRTSAPILACKCDVGDDTRHPPVQLPRFMTDPLAPILVPLDGSPQAERALPLAQELAQTFGNPLLLVRAVERPSVAGEATAYVPLLSESAKALLEEARGYLQRKRDELASVGLNVEIDCESGTAEQLIEQWAREREAGLVVMASHSRGWLGRMVFGSIAKGVLSQVQAPILLIRRGASQSEAQPMKAPSDVHVGMQVRS